MPALYPPVRHVRLTSISPAAGFSANQIAGAFRCTLQAINQNIWWTDDATTPTASNGQLLLAGAHPWHYEGDPSALLFLQAASGAELAAAMYGERSDRMH